MSRQLVWRVKMHTVIRTYSGPGAKELFDLVETRKADVERVIRAVPGFASYVLARTDDGGISVTTCETEAGTDESMRVASEWIRENASSISASPPKVTEAKVILLLE
jgi:hypothetical protein